MTAPRPKPAAPTPPAFRSRARRPLMATVAVTAVLGLTAVAAPAVADPTDDALLSPREAAAAESVDSPYLTQDDEGFEVITGGADAEALADKLGEADQRALAEAQAQEDATVTVLLAVDPGRTDAVEKAVDSLGGAVGRIDQSLGYVRATLPADEVETVAGRTDVKAVDLNRTISVPDPTPVAAGQDAVSAADADTFAAPDADTPAANAYMPVEEIGAVSFTDAHSEWDGRGTVIGILDTGVDLAHPALQTTTAGEPKIIDWFSATDPLIDGDATWKRMNTTVTGPSFRYSGVNYTAPAGSFRIAIVNESASGASAAAGDLNRDGDTSDRIPFIYDPVTHEVRVDTDLDGDFVEETAMLPYAVDHQVGYLGADDPATDVVESQGFAIQVREDVDLSPLGTSYVGKVDDFVNLGLVAGDHGTHVAGIAAGNGLFDGSMRGVAPGAQIVSAKACTWAGGCTAVALTEGMIDLVVEHDVDVVNVSIGGLVPLNDGNSAIAALYDRLVDTYDVDIVASAGNDGPGVNTASPPSTGGSVISVAASVSDDTWLANYGAQVPTDLDVFPFSARGPAEDGASKPTLSAPGSAVSSVPTWLPGAPVAEAGYDLPAGYGMFNGTSMAAPQVSGAVALLRSASAARGIDPSSVGMRSALVDSADLIEGVQVAAQGAGVVDVPAAWQRILVDGVAQPERAEYDIVAPVCSALSSVLTTPGQGAGVYDRCLPEDGGITPGTTKTYSVTVTRTSGAAGNGVHKLRLVGNDGTFDVPTQVRLPLGEPVTIKVTALADTAGLHSALLQVDAPATPGVDQVVPLTVIATEVAEAPARQVTVEGSVPRGGARSVFVAVPDGVQNLQVALTDAAGDPVAGGIRVRAFEPVGLPVGGDSCYTATKSCDPSGRGYSEPRAGIWEFVVEGARLSSGEWNGYRLTATLQGIEVTPSALTIDALKVQTAQRVDLVATNEWGTVDAQATTGSLGRTRTLQGSVADGGISQGYVDVPRDATLLDVTLIPQTEADLDVFLVHAASGTIAARGREVGAVPEHLVVRDPAPGTYVVVVQGMSVPAGSTTFHYIEKSYSPSLGTLTVAGAAGRTLQPGDSLALEVDVTAVAHPFGQTPLVGTVPLRNAEGDVVGSADVSVTSVRTPNATVLATDQPFVGSDMNSAGVVVGDDQINWRTTPVMWTPETGVVPLDMGADGYLGSAYGINEAGDVSGQILTLSGGIKGVMWRADGTLVEIGTPSQRAYTESYVYGLNDATDTHGVQVVGVSRLREKIDGVWVTHSDPWVWTDGEGFRMLPHLSDDDRASQAFAINDAGYLTGTALEDGMRHAVRWTPDGEIEDLGMLPGQVDAVGQAIDSAGDIVGVSGDDAFRWSPDTGLVRLADLGFDGNAQAMTDEGWVLGAVQTTPSTSTPVVWDPQGRLYDLAHMVDTSTSLLLESFAINGSKVLAYGYTVGGSGVTLMELPPLP